MTDCEHHQCGREGADSSARALSTARSGLTGYVAGVSRQVAGSGVTINNLLPGLHDTDRLVTLDKLDAGARGISEDDARQARMQSVPAGRFGTSEEFGGACAWLC